MALANEELIRLLRVTADRLSGDTTYQWGHMGMCNCGHLAQSLTGLTESEIHQSALARYGDWEQQARDYCPTSGLLIDHILAALLDVGMTRDDIRHLEKLSDAAVLQRLPRERRFLRFNRREDVVLYMRTWSEVLEAKLDEVAAAAV